MIYVCKVAAFTLLALLCTTTQANPQNTSNTGHGGRKPVNEQYPSAVVFGSVCAGTIISPTWILTAAHCTLIDNGVVKIVLAGTNNTANGTGVRRSIKRLVIHPSFTMGPFWLNAEQFGVKQIGARWDFLLAELQAPLPLDGVTMAAAVLDERMTIPTGEEVGIASFGADNYGEALSTVMKKRELQVLADADCSSLPVFSSTDMICTKGRPPALDTACTGDNGSGLMSQGKVIGVASWAENDEFACRKGAKVIFSRVAVARSWIKEVTNI